MRCRLSFFLPMFVCALVVLPCLPRGAGADVTMVQKTYNFHKYGEKEPVVRESVVRTWIGEGRLREDHGDPAGFIHITRLDRRPGELISYLINPGTGPFGNTYWTFCRPHAGILPRQNLSEKGDSAGQGEESASTDDTAESREGLTVVETGETGVINGFPCKKYVLKGNLDMTEFVSEVWASVEIGSVLDRYGLMWGVRLERTDSDLRFRETSGGFADYMRTIKGFPVKIVELEHNVHVRYERRVELTEFKEEPVASSHFDLPGGLTKRYRGAMARPPRCED